MYASDWNPVALVAFDAFCSALSFVFIGIHIYARYRFLGRPLPYLSDVFLVASWILFLPMQVINDCVAWTAGLYDPRLKYHEDGELPDIDAVVREDRMQAALIITLFTVITYGIAVCFLKMYFLLTYRRLFQESKTRLRFALHCTIGFVALGYAAAVLVYLLWCRPISTNWSLDPDNRCLAYAAVGVYFYCAAFQIVSDIIIYALPFFLLPTLSSSKTTRRELISLIAMLSLGFVCIMITVVRIIIIDYETGPTPISAFSAAEITAPQVVACLPMVRKLVKRRRSGREEDGVSTSRPGGLVERSWRSWRSVDEREDVKSELCSTTVENAPRKLRFSLSLLYKGP